jgi:hypothetical protein
MIVENLKIPKEEYVHLLGSGKFNRSEANLIQEYVRSNGYERVVIFGSETTGMAIRQLLGKRFCCFMDSGNIDMLLDIDADAILLATSPVHYPTITETIKDIIPDKSLPIVTLFDTSESLKILLILETQPRSGTHYTMDNLIRNLGCKYASVFKDSADQNLINTKDSKIFFTPGPEDTEYVVKAHFYQALHYPRYRFEKILFQISFLFDSYYSWGKLLSNAPAGVPYLLKSDSKEWATLKGFIKLNKQWLEYISDKYFLRYEDYYLNFEETINSISDIIGKGDLKGFERPYKNTNRMYWSDNYEKYLDKDVFHQLFNEFHPFISRYWPEKLATLAV